MNSQKGAAHILVLMILVLGLVAGLYLIQHPQIFKPKAYEVHPSGGGSSSGKAIKFNNEPTNSAFVSIRPINPPTTVASGGFTLEGWVKTPSAGTDNPIRNYSLVTYTINPRPGLPGGLNLFKLSLQTQERSDSIRSDGIVKPFFSAMDQNLSGIFVGSGNRTAWPADTWNHIAITASSSGPTCTLKMYLNGLLVDSQNKVVYPECKFSFESPGEILIAKPAFGLQGSNAYYYPGAIDEARFSKTVRYTDNFTPSTQSFVEDSDTLALYHFDGDVNDSSIYHYNTKMFGDISFIDSPIGNSTPSSGPIVKCNTDSECGEGMRCQLPICANPDPEQICAEAPDKAECFKKVEQKARERCAGRCVRSNGRGIGTTEPQGIGTTSNYSTEPSSHTVSE